MDGDSMAEGDFKRQGSVVGLGRITDVLQEKYSCGQTLCLNFGVDRILEKDPESDPEDGNRTSRDLLPKASVNGTNETYNEGSLLSYHHHLATTYSPVSTRAFITPNLLGTDTLQRRNLLHPLLLPLLPPLLPMPRGRPRKSSVRRAVFSDLQRKGLERAFQKDRYITKPDRLRLASKLGLEDSQVKIWFQNRRMKWRNRREREPLLDSQAHHKNRIPD